MILCINPGCAILLQQLIVAFADTVHVTGVHFLKVIHSLFQTNQAVQVSILALGQNGFSNGMIAFSLRSILGGISDRDDGFPFGFSCCYLLQSFTYVSQGVNFINGGLNVLFGKDV